jgi:hypothetical protein
MSNDQRAAPSDRSGADAVGMTSGCINAAIGAIGTSAGRVSSVTSETSIAAGAAVKSGAGLSISSAPIAAMWANRDIPTTADSVGPPEFSFAPLRLGADIGGIGRILGSRLTSMQSFIIV